MKHITITVSGNVQGVGFRHHTKEVARQYDIKGFVQNTYDGNVYIEAEGDDLQLELFTEWCKQGPRWAEVANVIILQKPLKGFKEFSIKY